MARTGRPVPSREQRVELWRRWKAGEALSDIGWVLREHAASGFPVQVSDSQALCGIKVREHQALFKAVIRHQMGVEFFRAPSMVEIPSAVLQDKTMIQLMPSDQPKDRILNRMRVSAAYQPAVLRVSLEGNIGTSVEDIAKTLLSYDKPQIK